MIKVGCLCCLLVWTLSGIAQNRSIAFPGAEGFGKYASGGRGGKLLIVTNLNDDGPGSLREAVKKKGARTIVFSVAGNIELKSPLNIRNDSITIAGQSAPGQGICISNYPVTLQANNVIIRFMRFRLGDVSGLEADAISGNRGNENVIIDHCSISWATDECASFYRNKNFTMQWCIISESLNHSVHTKGDHGYGGIWGGEGATFHHNLLAHHTSRLPRFSGSSTTPNPPGELVDFRNNVIYNWKNNNTYGGESGRYNMVNNYYKPGPASKRRNQILDPSSPFGSFYMDGNVYEGNDEISSDNWKGVKAEDFDSLRVPSAFFVETIQDQSARAAFAAVIRHAGASFQRDAVDERVIKDVCEGTGTGGKARDGIIDSQKDVGGWPALKSAPAPTDSDKDGIPDKWEKKLKLDPANPADGQTLSANGYTNLEIYLNKLVSTIIN